MKILTVNAFLRKTKKLGLGPDRITGKPLESSQAWVAELLSVLKAAGEQIRVPQELFDSGCSTKVWERVISQLSYPGISRFWRS